ncbi:Nif3-like dinuclear metal center hexameric protein [bacterium]|nr:Nif3-like dinuclear metal center hexameric protein [bacterium]
MSSLSELVSWLDSYLEIGAITDSSWNGLQVEGSTEVTKVALAVDAGHEVFVKVAASNSQLMIVHHGHFWDRVDPSLTKDSRQRLSPLLDEDISLYAAHLPLDRHLEVGNNAELLRVLGAKVADPWHFHEGINVSWLGEYTDGLPRQELLSRIQEHVTPDAHVLPFGPDAISRVAVITGSGRSGGFYEAVAAGADTYITGDPAYVYHAAKDMGVNVIFAGHYATETFGVKALGVKLAEQFGVDTEYIDVPTGI